ncbi:Inositol polyphosphate phosphatase [Mycena indigotica]|uniref:phosphoinositide 5-phosphatase n=1 Tax=Mycena indigotica TaxID=2126181 RepID=A0A8H6SNH0_9AGAR|nr:Inositol polyphosphate phosphatase [Mycena indigotica]KAF7301871.1 Inositol polyphosphate phosphatase [Mycena indigotica]
MYLYLSTQSGQRVLYLVATSQQRVLAFRHSDTSAAQAIVEFLPQTQVPLGTLIRLTTRVVKDVFLAVVTSATEVGNTRPNASTSSGESIARIHEVSFFSLTSPAWDELSNESLNNPESVDAMLMRDNYGQSTSPPVFEHPCVPLTKLLSSGSFYFAKDSEWDISSRLAIRLARGKQAPWDLSTFDEKFIWNAFLVRSLLDFRSRLDMLERRDFDSCQFIVLAIQGYVGVTTMALPAPPTDGKPAIVTLSLISRLGWKRAGTRFNSRGVDDDGNVANFVEVCRIPFKTPEPMPHHRRKPFSPPISNVLAPFKFEEAFLVMFWEQQGLQTFGQKIQITRPTTSQPAFDRHFASLVEEYGVVHAINLLGSKENEAYLTNAYARHLQIAREALGDEVCLTHYDFHNAVRSGGHDSVVRDLRRMEAISRHIDNFGFTMCDAASDEIVTEQKGIFRTNCLDCLDRTNFVQDIMSRTTLEQYILLVRREWTHSHTLWTNHRELWGDNGDALSKIYAGTGALNTSFTRTGKRTLAGVLSDATKSVSRAYINNFQDSRKQLAIDMFLGNMSSQQSVTIFDPIHESVRMALENRLNEYSSTKPSTIFIGTWNVNGRPPSESLLPWLFPRDAINDPDMFVLGFQEIVPLTAQQIVQTDPEKKRVWEARIMDTLDRRPNKKFDYVLLRSEQLVGTALMVIVKTDLASVMRNVEAASRKTGLRGMSGNKGAVAVRLEYHDTSFCFLTAHLAAGHANVEERNTDYRTITNGLHFQRGKTIDSHDNVIWLADTNYRIDFENESVRSWALSDNYDMLLAGDQLKQAIDTGAAFVGYDEGPLLFRPTYRYNLGTDEYDTSEKMRIPAWTDRILYRGPALDLGVYSRAELKGSDHKPVFGLFRCAVRIVDIAKREALSQLLLRNVIASASGVQLDEKLAALALPAAFDLPLPSSDEDAWWIGPEHPNGAILPSDLRSMRPGVTNPFDYSPDDSSLSSSTSSDEELYTDAFTLNTEGITLQTPISPVKAAIRKPPPPPPPPRRKPD